MDTEHQFTAIYDKFKELRVELIDNEFPPGTRPTTSDLWAMATALYLNGSK